MSLKQKIITMLPTGGRGGRLGVLTKNLTKPAVPHDGKYHIIDFPLSNCVNSGIETVGVPTQCQPLVLDDYIGSGQPWNLDSMGTGVHMLAPYQRGRKADWCEGTANMIYQNIPFVERYHPDYVVTLSGDHIYKMDYSKMIAYHKEEEADCIIAQIGMSWGETPCFGVLNTREDGPIYEFGEKPEKSKSNKASVGIYVFSWSKLRRYLEQDEIDSKSSNDFGRDLFPAMLGTGERIFVYKFSGYWKDVGAIESLWESNMDPLDPHTELDLGEPSWKIYSCNPVMPPHYLAPEAIMQNSSIAEGYNIYGEVDFTVLFADTYITPGAVVCDSITMPGSRVKEGAVIQCAIVSENAVVGKGAVVGVRPEKMDGRSKWGVAMTGESCVTAPGAAASAKAMINTEEMAK